MDCCCFYKFTHFLEVNFLLAALTCSTLQDDELCHKQQAGVKQHAGNRCRVGRGEGLPQASLHGPFLSGEINLLCPLVAQTKDVKHTSERLHKGEVALATCACTT